MSPETTNGTREVDVSPDLLWREQRREQARAEHWSLYAGIVTPIAFMVACQRGDEPIALVNRRLVQAGYRLDQLPQPVASREEDDSAPAPTPARTRTRPTFTQPFGEPIGPAEAVPAPNKQAVAPREAPETRNDARETAARRFSEAKGLPEHRKTRLSQTPLGRHSRFVRAKAAEWGRTDKVADQRIGGDHAHCEWRQPS
jgi:hypothetical protein